ncbi:MAG: flavin reductase family protein [Acidimicrobiia bacterium]|nr:flavin reductase family protein [Acidimicrobiia bacterium]
MDVDLFKGIVGSFATGVTVVTASHGDNRQGMTVSSFASISLDPLLVMVSLRPSKETPQLITTSGRFAVNMLAAEQQAISNRFAYGDPEDLFDDVPLLHDDPPVIAGTIGYFVCRLVDTHEGGDHVLYMGEPIEGEMFEGSPLMYWRGSYR